MNPVLMTVIFVLSAMSAYAQSQQPNAAKLKEDAENVVKIISGDKLKIQTYCEFADLSDQIEQAIQEQGTQKAKELAEKANEMQRKLGPEFAALADDLKVMDPNSQEGQEIGLILDKLDEFCGD